MQALAFGTAQQVGDRNEIAWGPEYEVEGGASTFFPGLLDGER